MSQEESDADTDSSSSSKYLWIGIGVAMAIAIVTALILSIVALSSIPDRFSWNGAATATATNTLTPKTPGKADAYGTVTFDPTKVSKPVNILTVPDVDDDDILVYDDVAILDFKKTENKWVGKYDGNRILQIVNSQKTGFLNVKGMSGATPSITVLPGGIVWVLQKTTNAPYFSGASDVIFF